MSGRVDGGTSKPRDGGTPQADLSSRNKGVSRPAETAGPPRRSVLAPETVRETATAPGSGAIVEATVVPMGPDGWSERAQAVLWSKGRIRLVGSSGQVAAEARRL